MGNGNRLVVAPFGVAQGYTPSFGRAVAASRRQFRRGAEAPLYPRSNGNGNGDSSDNGDGDGSGNRSNINSRSRGMTNKKSKNKGNYGVDR